MRLFAFCAGTAAAVLTTIGIVPFHTSPGSGLPFVALGAQARTAPGEIGGVVTGLRGTPLQGVEVQLVRDGAVVQRTTTDARGEFRFLSVSPGVYQVLASQPGLLPATLRVAVADLEIPWIQIALGVPADGWPRSPARGVAGGMIGGVVSGGIAGGLVGGLPAAPGSAAEGAAAQPPRRHNREAYGKIDENPFRRVADEPVSTFSTDVDTASYANVRRFLNDGRLPPPDAVRLEELINYFKYAYPDVAGDAPIAMTTEVGPAPWNPRHRLALVGLRARSPQSGAQPRKNLVFLLDVSGSMVPPDKLPLVRTAMRMLADTLTSQDRVAIVVYAGASGLVLPSTSGDRRAEIDRAIANLQAGGSTNGASGIQLAYDTAAASFVKDGVNRVILATDGDFNVGVTSQGDLVRLIETQRERGIFLSVLGVGTGNLRDADVEMLADRGNGNYSYLDSLHEARRVLIEEANATLVTVAKDVKIQIEFNLAHVAAYRLVGYENRVLDRQDFNDDRKDAGDLGAGHTVTALYELIPPGEPIPGPAVDPLVYQQPSSPIRTRVGELMTLKVRYKEPSASESELMSVPVAASEARLGPNLGFASAVAEFGMLLRRSEHRGEATWDSARALAREWRGEDSDGYRAELVRLLDLAAALDAQRALSGVEGASR